MIVVVILLTVALLFAYLAIYAYRRQVEVLNDIKARGPLYSIFIDREGNPSIEWHKTEQQILVEWQDNQDGDS